jgi:hypothetical protein
MRSEKTSGVEDGIFCPKEIATSEAVLPQSLSNLFLDAFLASETGEVEAGQVHDGVAGPYKFGFGTSWTRDDGKRGKVQTLSLGEGLFKWFWGPIRQQVRRFPFLRIG